MKIVTHDGTFHADEISGISMLSHYGYASAIERKGHVSSEELNDPDVIILDVGRVYDPVLRNFDHHQDSELPASNVLIADWLVKEGKMSKVVRGYLDKFLAYVSNVDRGVISGGGMAASFNAIIKAFNAANPSKNDVAFNKALHVGKEIMAAQIAIGERVEQDIERWKDLVLLGEGQHKVAVQESAEQIAGWNALAQEDGVIFLVMPNARGGWQLLSRDSQQFPIIPDLKQIFLHNAAFLAVYNEKQEAIDHALIMAVAMG